MADVSMGDVKEQPVMQPLQLPAIRTLWARLVDARRHGFRFPLLAALVILGSAWLFLGVLEDVAMRDPLVDVDVIVHGHTPGAEVTRRCCSSILSTAPRRRRGSAHPACSSSITTAWASRSCPGEAALASDARLPRHRQPGEACGIQERLAVTNSATRVLGAPKNLW